MTAKELLHNHLEECVSNGAFPGATYAVVTPNNVTLDFVGKRELYPNVVENSLDTIYDMASLTKVVSTTTLAMILLEQGKLRLGDKVKDFLPRFRYDNVTIWNLMTHTAGLKEGVGGRKDNISKEELINKIYNMEQIYTPGTKIIYSDCGFILLGFIIEAITKKPLNIVAKELLFDPLEMYDTGYLPKDKERCAATEYRDDLSFKGYCKGFVHDETAGALEGVAGHAGLFSTASDMVHFIQMFLNDGVYKGKRILSKATIDMLYRVQVKEYAGLEMFPKGRHIGWQALEVGSSAGDLVSPNTILHTGFTGTNLWIDRTNKIGFVMLSNRVHPTRNNSLHLHARATSANIVMSHLEEW